MLNIPKKSKKAQIYIYSTQCVHSYWCRDGLKCNYTHTDEEKKFFKANPDASYRYSYKSRACTFGERCKHKGNEKMCKFAHGLLEARCAKCKVIGEHWADECPKRRNM